jgi:hypothetical protein
LPSSFLAYPSPPTITVHALPGTHHAILSGFKQSLDLYRQQQYIKTIVDQSTSSLEGPYPFYASPRGRLPRLRPANSLLLFCNSFLFVIDTGANRFIVNDQSLFTTFKPCSGVVIRVLGVTHCRSRGLELSNSISSLTLLQFKTLFIFRPPPLICSLHSSSYSNSTSFSTSATSLPTDKTTWRIKEF